jgi:hypothetical protein
MTPIGQGEGESDGGGIEFTAVQHCVRISLKCVGWFSSFFFSCGRKKISSNEKDVGEPFLPPRSSHRLQDEIKRSRFHRVLVSFIYFEGEKACLLPATSTTGVRSGIFSHFSLVRSIRVAYIEVSQRRQAPRFPPPPLFHPSILSLFRDPFVPASPPLHLPCLLLS